MIGVVLATAVGACGGSSNDASQVNQGTDLVSVGTDDAPPTDPSQPDQLDESDPDAAVTELLAMTDVEQQAYLRQVAADFDLLLAEQTGLEEVLGGPEETAVALQEAWIPLFEHARQDIDRPLVLGFRSVAAPAPTVGEGLFGTLMMTGLGSEAIVSASNDLAPGKTEQGTFGEAIKVALSTKMASGDIDLTNTSAKGVTTKLKVHIDVLPCPESDGRFQAHATADMSATSGSVGGSATIEVTVDGQLDDGAQIASKNIDFRMQMANFANGAGQFADVSGGYTGDEFNGVTVNRTGGEVTQAHMSEVMSAGTLFGVMIANQLTDAARKGWESGRCVKLEATANPGPKGLQPSSNSTITAKPTSKLDGMPTGGSVTALLTAGGNGVDPSSTPLPADAEFTYRAPDETGKGGTVSLEARSKRGVGKATIDFETGGAPYLIVGGLQDWQVNQVVCDIMQPFTLTADIGSMELTGGLTGNYEFNGMFNSHYTGTYEISLPDGPGQPGMMVGVGAGTVANQAGSGTENYTLTPADAC